MNANDDTKNTNEVLAFTESDDVTRTKVELTKSEKTTTIFPTSFANTCGIYLARYVVGTAARFGFVSVAHAAHTAASIGVIAAYELALVEKFPQEIKTQDWEIKENEINNIFEQIKPIDLRIQEHQKEIDNLKAETKKMIDNLTVSQRLKPPLVMQSPPSRTNTSLTESY